MQFTISLVFAETQFTEAEITKIQGALVLFSYLLINFVLYVLPVLFHFFYLCSYVLYIYDSSMKLYVTTK